MVYNALYDINPIPAKGTEIGLTEFQNHIISMYTVHLSYIVHISIWNTVP